MLYRRIYAYLGLNELTDQHDVASIMVLERIYLTKQSNDLTPSGHHPSLNPVLYLFLFSFNFSINFKMFFFEDDTH